MPELKSMATDADNNTYLAGDAVIRHVSVFGARGGRGMASDILIQACENRNVGASVCNHGIGQTSEAELFFYKAANLASTWPCKTFLSCAMEALYLSKPIIFSVIAKAF